jgi:asparagine synthase (glutamine-hydrolysing)
MSGIAGIMLRGRRQPSVVTLQALGEAMAHRGAPSGEPVLTPGVGLIGRGEASAPASTGAATLVASHRLAGADALRAAHGLGEAPAAELPLLLYRRQGLGFGAGLDGGHALAVHDHAMRRLVLARDGFGLAPLYVAETEEGIAFASEAQALVAAGLVAPRLRAAARDELLQLRFTTGAETIFEGISRVLPAESLAIADGAIVERRRHPPLPEGGPETIGEAAALARFEAAFLASVAARLTPGAGLILAGGANGAALLAAARGLGVADLPAFAPVLAGEDSPGHAGAEPGAVAQHHLAARAGVRVVPVPVTRADFWAVLPALAGALDDPSADPGLVLTWMLAAAARHQVPALLSGDGANELLAGRGRHRAAMRPWWLWGRAMRARGAFDRLDALRIEPRAWRDGIAAAEAAEAGGGRSRLQVAQAVDMGDWLANGLLTGLDRCLARHGIEARAPFLDAAVAAACFRLPDQLKVRRRQGKWLLRAWLARAWPGAPPSGVGTGAPRLPIGAWIEAEAARLGPLVARQPGVAEVCRAGRVEALFRRATDRRAGAAAWNLLFYALWHRAHIERRPMQGDTFEALR